LRTRLVTFISDLLYSFLDSMLGLWLRKLAISLFKSRSR
jgi:hypothetical protein